MALKRRNHAMKARPLPEQTTRMPPSIADVFTSLKDLVVETHFRWLTYRELFASSPARVELLNECASHFFAIIQDILLTDVQLNLCKATEPARTGKYENLSLEQLQERLATHGEWSLAQRCGQLLRQIQSLSEHIRDRRNKKLAHSDLASALGTTPTPLPGVTRMAIEDTLHTVRTYMNAIESHYDNAETAYEHSIINEGATAIVARLRDSRRYREHIRAGRLPVDDWRYGHEDGA